MYSEHYVDIEQLRIGLYIHLDLSWMNHPFSRNNFKINDEAQIEKIKQIGLKKLRYDPLRSECEPLSLEAEKTPETKLEEKPLAEPIIIHTAADVKQERFKQLKHAIDESEKKFISVSDVVKDINANILNTPKATLDQATTLVNQIVETALLESDIVIHAINGNRSSDANYQHPLNVTVLSLMLGKNVSMSQDEMQLLGIGAMLHDIGKTQIKTSSQNTPENIEKLHCAYGAQIIHKLGLPSRVGRILLQHHECWDGSGVPDRLKGEQIDPLARILFLTNLYDNLCNPAEVSEAKSPYEALRLMFTHFRAKFDDDLLKRFIKSLGVYPPGSIVKLSDGHHGTVISVNPNQPLRPYIQLQDDGENMVPMILNLQEETDLNITNCLNRSQLSPNLLQTLRPRKRVNYFIDQAPSMT